jgi:hypothetical protein
MCWPLSVRDVKVDVLIDSGAAMNMCKSHVLVTSVSYTVHLINSDPVRIKSPGSTQTAAIGRATIPLEFGGKVI